MRSRAFLLAVALPFLPLAACGGGGMGGLADQIQEEIEEEIDSGNPGGGDPVLPASMTEHERDLALDCFDRVNAERASAGVPELLWRDDLTDAAFLHSADMDERDFFDHVNPDGEDPGERLRDAGVAWSGYGENIAMGYVDAEEVMSGWMTSEGHRENLLDPSFTEVGIGVRWAAGGPFWTQDFVRR